MSYKSKENITYDILSIEVDYTKYTFEFLVTNTSDKKNKPVFTIYTKYPDEEITSLKEYTLDEIDIKEKIICKVELDLMFFAKMDDYDPLSDTFMTPYLNPGVYEFYIGDEKCQEFIYSFSYDEKIIFKID